MKGTQAQIILFGLTSGLKKVESGKSVQKGTQPQTILFGSVSGLKKN